MVFVLNLFTLFACTVVFIKACPGNIELSSRSITTSQANGLINNNDNQYCYVYSEDIVININTKASFGCLNNNATKWPSFVGLSNFASNGSVDISCSLESNTSSVSNNTQKCFIDRPTILSNSTSECWARMIDSFTANSPCLNGQCLSVSCSIRYKLKLLDQQNNQRPNLSVSLTSVNNLKKHLHYILKPVSNIQQCQTGCQETKLSLSSIPYHSNTKPNTLNKINIKIHNVSHFANHSIILYLSIRFNASLNYINSSCSIGSLEEVDTSIQNSISFNINTTSSILDCNLIFTSRLCQVLPVIERILYGEAIIHNSGSEVCIVNDTLKIQTEYAVMHLSAQHHLNLVSNETLVLKTELYLQQCMFPLIVKVRPTYYDNTKSATNPNQIQSFLELVPNQDISSSVTSQNVIMNTPLSLLISNHSIELNFGDVTLNGSSHSNGLIIFTLKFLVKPMFTNIPVQSADIIVTVSSLNVSSSLPLTVITHANGAFLGLVKEVESVNSIIDKTSMTLKLTVSHLSSSTQTASNVTITDMASSVLVENAWSLQNGEIIHVQAPMRNEIMLTAMQNSLPVGENFTVFYTISFIAGSHMSATFGSASVTWKDQQLTDSVFGPVASNDICINAQTRDIIEEEPSYGFIALGVFGGLFFGTVITMVVLYLIRKTTFMKKLHGDFELSQEVIDAEGRDTTFHLSDGYGLDSSRESDGINNEILTKESFGYWICFAASASPVDADVLITRDMVRDICDYQKRSSDILLQCWQGTIRCIVSNLCQGGDISCDTEFEASQSIDNICSEVNNEIAVKDPETWYSVSEINNTCCQIVKNHSIVALRTQERGQRLLDHLIASSNIDGITKKSLIETYELSNRYMTKSLDDYMECIYEECQKMAWKRRSMALLLSFSHNRYFVLIDWLVKKFLMELDLLQRKRVLSSELAQTISNNVKETAGKASLRYHLAVKTHVVNVADRTATHYMKQIKAMESKWSSANSSAMENNKQSQKSKRNSEIEGAIDKRIFACREIEKELFNLKCNLDDKAYNNLKKYLADTRRTSVEWFTTLMVKIGNEIDSQTVHSGITGKSVSGAETTDATQEATHEARESLDSEYEKTTICDVISETVRQVPHFDTITNDEIEAAHCLIQVQLKEELKVLTYNYGNCSLLKEIRRKAKVIIRSVLGSCPCNGKLFIQDLFERWSLSVTNRVLGRFLFKGLTELQFFDCKLKTRKHTEIFTAILPTHSLQKLLENQKHDLQGLIRYLITRIDKVYVKNPENADCIFKDDLFTMLKELIDDQSRSMKKLLQWQDELKVMGKFIEMVAASEWHGNDSDNDSEGVQRCMIGYFKDVKVLLSLDFDYSHDLTKNDKGEISTVLCRFLDHVNRLTQHNQPNELDLDFILLDENETVEAMVTLAADSAHLANATSAVVSLESKNIECFATLFKMATFPRQVFYSILNDLNTVVSPERMKEISSIVFGQGKQQINYSQEIVRQECKSLIQEKNDGYSNKDGTRKRLVKNPSKESVYSQSA